MSEKFPLSVAIITKNEEANIAECLESVMWCNDVIVLDDYSNDTTVDIAKRYTDKVLQRQMKVEGIHRNYAYSLAKNEWVLSLDADEKVSDELRQELIATISANPKFSAFSIPLRNFIGNYWVKHGGWYPAGKLRLFRKDKFKYEEVGVHPRAILDGECGHLKFDIIHKGYPDFEHFLASVNRQTTLEAKKWFETKRRMSFKRAFYRAVDRFIRSFFVKKGYKDGLIGFMVAYFASMYQLVSYAKYCQLKNESQTTNHE